MKKIILIMTAVMLTSCGTYKETHFKEVSGTITDIEVQKGITNIKVNDSLFIGYYGKELKLKDSVRVKYFYSPRNKKNNIKNLKIIK